METTSRIIERIALQSDTFQESFDILSQAKDTTELATKFFHVLRANLLILNAAIYFKPETGEWQELLSKTKFPIKNRDELLDAEMEFRIIPIKHAEFSISVNQPLADNASFRILLGNKLDKSDFTNFHKITLQFYLQQLASAYRFIVARNKEKQLAFSLNHKALQLNGLINAGIELARLQEPNNLFQLALERVLAITNASGGLLQIKKEGAVVDELRYPHTYKLRDAVESHLKISATFNFSGNSYYFSLFEKESRRGTVAFDTTDQLLLDAFARQVNASLENHFLLEQSLEKERVENEISLAGSIQEKLIPRALPEIAGFEHTGLNIPTKFIGGDYYDCIPIKDGRYMYIMADVSGKGVAAGLLVSTLHAALHAFLETPFQLVELVQKLNRIIWNAATEDKYITAMFALLDPETSQLETLNAGHNPTYYLTGQEIVELKLGGIPLGMMEIDFPYESQITRMKPEDKILFYTDGVTEAMNAAEEEFDDVRPLKDLLLEHRALSAQKFIRQLMAELQDFTGDTPQSDDITIMYLRKE